MHHTHCLALSVLLALTACKASVLFNAGTTAAVGDCAVKTEAPAPMVEGPPPPDERHKASVRGEYTVDWALRFFGGYTLIHPGTFRAHHGGHFGVAVHASRRFGRRGRGYIGGGPRLHYRGGRHLEPGIHSIQQFGPEGNLLLGGGSDKVVGLVSLRLGLGLTTNHSRSFDGLYSDTTAGFGGWLLGGVTVLRKLTKRWSLGGYAEAGITGPTAAPILEVGLSGAWHFGEGRRDSI